MKMFFFILLIFSVSHARDPDALPYDYEYREHQTVGGNKWTGADTFVLCGVAVMAVMIFALPEIFDGEYREWPVHKFNRRWIVSPARRWGALITPRRFLFPTRQLCGSY